MKNTYKNILRTLLALLIVLCMLGSMTSCLFIDFSFMLDDYLEENFGEEGDDGDSNPPGNPDDGNPDDGTSEEEEEIVFYPSDGSDANNASALNKTLLSTVIVESKFTTAPAYGSGVIYKLDRESGDAYIITNCHVIFDSSEGVCKNVNVYLFGMELSKYAISATVVGRSITFDIAVLKVTGSEIIKNSMVTEATIGNSDDISVFDTVYAVGNPEANGISATKGMISVVSEYLDLTGADDTMIEIRVIRTDAAVNSGNSGGGLYDNEGRLIGIVSAKLVGSDIDNMGYAIPSNLAKNLVDNIIDNCDGVTSTQLHRVLMGIQITSYVTGVTIDPETGSIKRVSLVEISDVFEDSVVLGKVLKGDIINSITVGDETVVPTQIYHVTDHMLTARVGDTVTLGITRGEESLTISFTVSTDRITLVK